MLLETVIAILELVFLIWALLGILQSGAPPIEKLIWVLVVILMPLLGFLLWYLIGPGQKAFPLRR